MFASHDIALLVESFPPPAPTPRQIAAGDAASCLVRSRSRDSVLLWSGVVERFRGRIAQSTSRIDRQILPSWLGVDDSMVDILQAEFEAKLSLSSDSRYIVPELEQSAIVRDLESRAQNACVDLRMFAREKKIDISLLSLERLLDFAAGKDDYHYFRDDSLDGSRVFSSRKFLSLVERRIRDTISSAGHNDCDLTYYLSHLAPFIVLQRITTVLVAELGASLKTDGQRVIVKPPKFLGPGRRNFPHETIARLAQDLKQNGFCLISGSVHPTLARPLDTQLPPAEDDRTQAVLAELDLPSDKESNLKALPILDDAKISPKRDDRHGILILRQDVFQSQLEILRNTLISFFEKAWASGDRAAVAISFIQIAFNSDPPILDGVPHLLLQTECLGEIEQSARECLHNLETREREDTLQCVQNKLLIPWLLHAAGIASTTDGHLKQNLEVFVLDYFRRDIIPSVFQTLEQRNLLHDKPRSRELNKFRSASNDAKSFPTLQSAITKLAKKLEIPHPSPADSHAAKLRTSRQTLRAINQMSRASDVLQHLIWTCLASVTEGLYISSGKDTSRMIRAYAELGDGDTAATLTRWRDVIKAGEAEGEVVGQMRALARTVIGRMEAASAEAVLAEAAGAQMAEQSVDMGQTLSSPDEAP